MWRSYDGVSAAVLQVSLDDFDTIIHYYPTQLITGYCAVGGWAYDRTVLINPSSTGPPFTVDRTSTGWRRGISIRRFYQSGTGTVLLHEFGHQYMRARSALAAQTLAPRRVLATQGALGSLVRSRARVLAPQHRAIDVRFVMGRLAACRPLPQAWPGPCSWHGRLPTNRCLRVDIFRCTGVPSSRDPATYTHCTFTAATGHMEGYMHDT
jgi:hypothetical protein